MNYTKLFSVLLSFIILFSGCNFSQQKDLANSSIKQINNINSVQNSNLILTKDIGCNAIDPIVFKTTSFNTKSFSTKSFSASNIIEDVNFLLEYIEKVKTFQKEYDNLNLRGDIVKRDELNIILQKTILERNSIKQDVLSGLNDYKLSLRTQINTLMNNPNFSIDDSYKAVTLSDYKNRVDVLKYNFDRFIEQKNTNDLLEALNVLTKEIKLIYDLLDDYSNNKIPDLNLVVSPPFYFSQLDNINTSQNLVHFFSTQISYNQDLLNTQMKELVDETEIFNNKSKLLEDEIADYDKSIEILDFYISNIPNTGFTIQSNNKFFTKAESTLLEKTFSNGTKFVGKSLSPSTVGGLSIGNTAPVVFGAGTALALAVAGGLVYYSYSTTTGSEINAIEAQEKAIAAITKLQIEAKKKKQKKQKILSELELPNMGWIKGPNNTKIWYSKNPKGACSQLRKNMKKANEECTDAQEAHHIIAKGHKDTVKSAKLIKTLKKAGSTDPCFPQGIDDPENGACLGKESGEDHDKTKSDEMYYKQVDRLVLEANSSSGNPCENVKKTLKEIKDSFKTGKFGVKQEPINAKDHKDLSKDRFDLRNIKFKGDVIQ